MVYELGIQTPSPIGNFGSERALQGLGSQLGGANLNGLLSLAIQGTYAAEKMKVDNSIHFDSAVEGPRKTYQESAKLLDGWA
jgi:hypothetical protein